MPVVTSVFTSFRLVFSEIGSFQIVGTIFSLCRVSGAIYFSNVNSNFTMFNSAFDRCKNSDHGGGINCEKAFSFVTRTICFYDCEAYRCPGFFLNGHYFGTYSRTHMNFSSEFNPKPSGAASALYGRKNTMYWNNNISKSFCNDLSAGINFGNAENTCVGKYFIIFESTGPGFLRFHSSISPSSFSFSHFNIINHFNSPVSSWLAYATSHHLSIFNSVFRNITQAQMFSGSSGSASFSYCSFEIPYNSAIFSGCSTTNNIYNTYSSPNEFDLVNTASCWGPGTLEITSPYKDNRINWISIIIFLLL